MKDEMVAMDARLSARLRVAEQPGLIRNCAILLAHSGDSPLWLIGLLLTLWLGSTFWKREAWLDLVGVAATALLVQTLKIAFRRRRPAGEWGQGYRKIDPHSFPSGHAARAAMLAVVAVALGPIWWAALLLAWAPLVALARVAMGVHYVSDVVVGAVCGAACGMAVLTLLPA
jgi:undecaprenyl-diphosphatase